MIRSMKISLKIVYDNGEGLVRVDDDNTGLPKRKFEFFFLLLFIYFSSKTQGQRRNFLLSGKKSRWGNRISRGPRRDINELSEKNIIIHPYP